MSQVITKYAEWGNFISNEPLLCYCKSLVTKHLYCDMKLKLDPDTALSLIKTPFPPIDFPWGLPL